MRWLAACAVATSLSGCYDTGKLAPIEPTPDDLDALEICDGSRYGELKFADTLDDTCRSEVELLRPDPVSSFAGRLIVLGEDTNPRGSPRLYLMATDEEGVPLSLDAWSRLRVEVGYAGGASSSFDAAELGFTPLADVGAEAMAVVFLIDESGTMRDVDRRAAADFAGAVLDALPQGYEAAVARFSEEAQWVQDFTSDRAQLDLALAPGAEASGASAALYDGMGLGLEALGVSANPVRLLVTATDGPDSASREYRRSEVAALAERHRAAGLFLGALFAESPDLRAMFAERGAALQAPSFDELRPSVAAFSAALGAAIVLELPVETASAERYRLLLGDTGVLIRRPAG